MTSILPQTFFLLSNTPTGLLYVMCVFQNVFYLFAKSIDAFSQIFFLDHNPHKINK